MVAIIETAILVPVIPENNHSPLVRRMSSPPGLTTGVQLRYILQWFGEFSELQREDFVPILAAAVKGETHHLESILTSLSCQDKPLSLFQCRIKLFNEWYPSWSEEEQHRLVAGVTDIDGEFGQKLQDILTQDIQVNGETNGTNGIHHDDEQANGDDEKALGNDGVQEGNIAVEIAAS